MTMQQSFEKELEEKQIQSQVIKYERDKRIQERRQQRSKFEGVIAD